MIWQAISDNSPCSHGPDIDNVKTLATVAGNFLKINAMDTASVFLHTAKVIMEPCLKLKQGSSGVHHDEQGFV
jgi:hypothetical protein